MCCSPFFWKYSRASRHSGPSLTVIAAGRFRFVMRPPISIVRQKASNQDEAGIIPAWSSSAFHRLDKGVQINLVNQDALAKSQVRDALVPKQAANSVRSRAQVLRRTRNWEKPNRIFVHGTGSLGYKGAIKKGGYFSDLAPKPRTTLGVGPMYSPTSTEWDHSLRVSKSQEDYHRVQKYREDGTFEPCHSHRKSVSL